jgi:hypothetical protein
MTISKFLSFLFISFFCLSLNAYPIDGYAFSKIKRLLWLQKVLDGEVKDRMPVPGALLPIDSIELSLINDTRRSNWLTLPDVDPEFQKQLNRLFPNLDESYSISVLDYSEGQPIRYAEKQGDRGFQPGSVGKLAVITGLFCELESIYPDDYEKRIELLKTKVVMAGNWALPNIHTVPIYHPETGKLEKRLLIAKDEFTLFEWADHMLSVSSNGAASVVWREAMLMRAFGSKYPDLTTEEADEYFKTTSRKVLSDMSISVVNDPLRDFDISDEEWRLGTFFTRGGSDKVPPQGGSTATPKALMKWLLALQTGHIVDEASSLEIKRLLYMTDRRIRYASNGALKDAAVYYKSGSLYQCRPEPGFTCAKYMGNKNNFMNSVAIVERSDSSRYMVTLMTNVLKKNSNNDHSALGGKIDALIRQDKISI